MSGAIPPLPLHVFMALTGKTLCLPLFIYSWCINRPCRSGYSASNGRVLSEYSH